MLKPPQKVWRQHSKVASHFASQIERKETQLVPAAHAAESDSSLLESVRRHHHHRLEICFLRSQLGSGMWWICPRNVGQSPGGFCFEKVCVEVKSLAACGHKIGIGRFEALKATWTDQTIGIFLEYDIWIHLDPFKFGWDIWKKTKNHPKNGWFGWENEVNQPP